MKFQVGDTVRVVSPVTYGGITGNPIDYTGREGTVVNITPGPIYPIRVNFSDIPDNPPDTCFMESELEKVG